MPEPNHRVLSNCAILIAKSKPDGIGRWNWDNARHGFHWLTSKRSRPRAGYQVIEPQVDDDSVDGILMGRHGRRPRIEFQAKASARDLLRDGHVVYPLPIKNYDDLRAETIVPRILIVVLMPDEQEQWLSHSEEALTMRYCGYWLSLQGAASTCNSETVTVRLPRRQTLDSGALLALMAKAEQGTPL